tara:strand:+ start:22 stop:423 length:402 start_codon:yes stop_codon:yes gene_type:complete
MKYLLADWFVRTYDEGDNILDSWIINDRTEQEAAREAMHDPSVLKAHDWSMVCVDTCLRCKETTMTMDRLAMMLPLTTERKEFIDKYSELYNVEPWQLVVFCVDILMDMDDDTVFDEVFQRAMKTTNHKENLS